MIANYTNRTKFSDVENNIKEMDRGHSKEFLEFNLLLSMVFGAAEHSSLASYCADVIVLVNPC